MNWIDNISDDELVDACAELGALKQWIPSSADEALSKVRDNMAEVIHFGPRFIVDPASDPYNGTRLMDNLLDEHAKTCIVPDELKRSEFDKKKKAYWGKVKEEIRILLCTKNKKYSRLRTELESYGENTKHTVVALVSSAIGSSIGVASGIITGLVAIALFAVVRIGISAYCASEAV